jgi:hypothetical protein
MTMTAILTRRDVVLHLGPALPMVNTAVWSIMRFRAA